MLFAISCVEQLFLFLLILLKARADWQLRNKSIFLKLHTLL